MPHNGIWVGTELLVNLFSHLPFRCRIDFKWCSAQIIHILTFKNKLINLMWGQCIAVHFCHCAFATIMYIIRLSVMFIFSRRLNAQKSLHEQTDVHSVILGDLNTGSANQSLLSSHTCNTSGPLTQTSNGGGVIMSDSSCRQTIFNSVVLTRF
jgi:hypothetical protein